MPNHGFLPNACKCCQWVFFCDVCMLGVFGSFSTWVTCFQGYEMTNVQSNLKEVLWHQPNVYIFDLAVQQWSRQPTRGLRIFVEVCLVNLFLQFLMHSACFFKEGKLFGRKMTTKRARCKVQINSPRPKGSLPPPAHTYASAHTLLESRWVFWCGGYYGQVLEPWEGLPLSIALSKQRIHKELQNQLL